MTAVVQAPRRRGWWRWNIGWLLMLPVVAVATLAVSSHRLVNLWQYQNPVQRVDAVGPGGTAHFEGEYFDLGLTDPDLENTWVDREVDVALLAVEPADALPDSLVSTVTTIPDGAEAWRVDLELSAEPGTDMGLCQVVLVATDGTRYGEGGQMNDPLSQGNPCLPPDSLESVAPDSGTWQASTMLLTREDSTFEEVWFSFGYPHYVVLDVPPRG